MSTCGVCGQQLIPGMGHACSTVGAPRVISAQPRIQTAKTWRELERMAAGDHLQLLRTEGCVSVLSIETPPRTVVTITTEILRDEDADRVVRRALEATLDALGSLHR